MSSIPPGIITESTRLPDGVVYVLSHQQFGPLGRLILSDVPTGGMQISAEVVPGDVSDPAYLLRIELLCQVVQACLDVLPGENPPVPGLQEARQRVLLYQRFLAVPDPATMGQFVSRLSTEEQICLLAIIADNASATIEESAPGCRYGITQRRNDLLRFIQDGREVGA